MGSVGLSGLVDADVSVLIEFLPDEDGNVRPPIRRTVKEVMLGSKINSIRLFQSIMTTESGSWEAYYPNGIGCSNHQTTARSWGGQTAAESCFYMQKRGVTEESVFRLLVASFSTESVQQAETATLRRNGKVINKRQQAMQSEIAAIDNCDWIDNKAG